MENTIRTRIYKIPLKMLTPAVVEMLFYFSPQERSRIDTFRAGDDYKSTARGNARAMTLHRIVVLIREQDAAEPKSHALLALLSR